jgi:hypothetical protein
MPTRIRPRLATPIALLALVIACGGTAVAAGVAKDSVTSRSIKNNAVQSKDVKDGALTAADIQDGSLGAVDVRDDALTGADIAEGTLTTVPNATSVGGVQVSPLVLSLPSTSTGVPVLNVSGTELSLDCGGSLVLLYSRSPSGPPMTLTSVTSPNTVYGDSLSPNESVFSNIADGQVTASIVLPAGGSVTAEFTAIYEVDAAGANDCFYRGTITRIP